MSGDILLIGNGGHCASVLDAVLASGWFDQIGIVAREAPAEKVMGVPVVGCDRDLPNLRADGWENAFITLGSVGSTAGRERICKLLDQLDFSIPNIIDPTAAISPSAILKGGVFIGKRAVVNARARIGRCAILNTGCIVEHDCMLGDFSHVAPGAVLCGNVRVGHGTHIGANSSVRQGVTIGTHVMIGLGSTVVHDIGDKTVAYGNPCRERR